MLRGLVLSSEPFEELTSSVALGVMRRGVSKVLYIPRSFQFNAETMVLELEVLDGFIAQPHLVLRRVAIVFCQVQIALHVGDDAPKPCRLPRMPTLLRSSPIFRRHPGALEITMRRLQVNPSRRQRRGFFVAHHGAKGFQHSRLRHCEVVVQNYHCV